jgi:Skp family chaperone for outer membrane proteins
VSLSRQRAISLRTQFAGGARIAAFIALTAIAFGAVGTRPASAQSASNMMVGSVDVQKVLDGYTKKTTTEADFQKVVDRYGASYKLLQDNTMLSPDDMQTLSTLLLKPNPTAADTAQIQQLETKSQNDANELTALQQKQNLTDADKARLSALTQEQQASQQALQQVGDSYKQTLDAQNQQQSQQLEDQVRVAVAAVAKKKGLAVVFDSSLAIYASNDVTQEVLAQLNGSGK